MRIFGVFLETISDLPEIGIKKLPRMAAFIISLTLISYKNHKGGERVYDFVHYKHLNNPIV